MQRGDELLQNVVVDWSQGAVYEGLECSIGRALSKGSTVEETVVIGRFLLMAALARALAVSSGSVSDEKELVHSDSDLSPE
jgi:hypothetical protein